MTPPSWFLEAIETPAESRFVSCHDASIHYRRYAREEGRPFLLFVHGHGAHCRWWDFIAPSFIRQFNVAAMDMSGAGDSDHRASYRADIFADEIMAVCDQESVHGNAFVVGHSFGGSMSRIAAWRHGDRLAGLVLADSVVAGGRGRRSAPQASRGRIRYYPSLAEAKRRFRLRPPQPCDNDYIIDYIATHSVRETESGWRFKLDQDVFAKMEEAEPPPPDGITTLREMACEKALIYGELSRFFPAEAVSMAANVIDPELIEVVPGAHHHLFLDRPLAFVEALERMLEALRYRRS